MGGFVMHMYLETHAGFWSRKTIMSSRKYIYYMIGEKMYANEKVNIADFKKSPENCKKSITNGKETNAVVRKSTYLGRKPLDANCKETHENGKETNANGKETNLCNW